ncbi:MAG: hypothetical protein V3T72_13400 [Thermoanaerobaculia bacterium]
MQRSAFLLLALMAAAPAAEAARVHVRFEPAFPTELDETSVVLTGEVGCPILGGVDRQRRDITVELATGCPLAPPLPSESYRFEASLGKLEPGSYRVRVLDDGGALRFEGPLVVDRAAVRPIVFSPAVPNARDHVIVTVTLEGLRRCRLFRSVAVRGHFIDVDVDESCLAPSPPNAPAIADFDVVLEPLAATRYRLRLRDSSATVLATADLVVQPADRCVTGDAYLCLNGGRFRAEVVWKTPHGGHRTGHAASIGDDSGMFWFHERDNVELVVKVLDACRPPFNRFWVFAAGLTDLETTLVVTDLRSGQTRRYHSRKGKSFEPVLDAQAFATCP